MQKCKYTPVVLGLVYSVLVQFSHAKYEKKYFHVSLKKRVISHVIIFFKKILQKNNPKFPFYYFASYLLNASCMCGPEQHRSTFNNQERTILT